MVTERRLVDEPNIGKIIDFRIAYCVTHGVPRSHVVNRGVLTHTRWFDPVFHAEFDAEYARSERWRKDASR